jgi:hypothetical protein
MICKAPSGAAQPVVDLLHAVDVRWSKFPRPPFQQNPRSSKRSPRGPVASTRVRIRWRSARVPRTDQVRLVAAAVRNPADGRSARTYSRHHPACQRSHRGPARHAHVRTIRRESEVTRLCMEGLSTRQMAHALALSPLTVQDHLKVDLRQDRRPKPQRAGQPNLPRALRAPLGRHPRRSCRLDREGITDRYWR